MKKFLFFLITLVIINNTYSQDYKSGIGVRAGYSNGISFKSFISNKNALEFFATNRYGGFALTGMYLFQDQSVNPFDVEDLSFYYGLGAHVGYYDKDRYYSFNYIVNDQVFNLGVDCVFGAEYKVPTVPITLSIDVKPFIDFIGNVRFLPLDFGISIRYVF
ncbi:MAG: hypothetical protein A2X12_01330 [Bacteroidetes bacterium GWE2_29_8]|nr:MAG: hypothetical protein A2X12_01330 [Bacteroidetes bacterium GWE2_29_8]OFY21745.1 MAG: hypothetical protein A2X02_00255 [Bacteroidetes bacterium GWF2_29_10]